jgi:hypothetical protein
VIADFSEKTSRFILNHETEFPGTAGFLNAVVRARKATSSISSSYSFEFYLKVDPSQLGSDPVVVFPRLLGEVEGWLGFIVHSVAYRICQFLDDLITGIEAARPYRSVGSARGLVELSAFVRHHTELLRSKTETLSSVPDDDLSAVVRAIVDTLASASLFAQATRFNWNAYVRGDMDEFFTAWNKVDERIEATNILTLIDKLPSETKHAARFYYEMLCDYVHPNAGAHTLVVDSTENPEKGKVRWNLSREPGSDEALSVLVHTLAIPVRASIDTLLHDLEQLQQIRKYFLEWKERCESFVKHGIK